MDTEDKTVLGWALEMGGEVVQLSFHGRNGPQEIVTRHPTNWGWVLYSQGTCWTSWEMPSREKEDPLLKDEALHRLPTRRRLWSERDVPLS